jgi:hypothetical protein
VKPPACVGAQPDKFYGTRARLSTPTVRQRRARRLSYRRAGDGMDGAWISHMFSAGRHTWPVRSHSACALVDGDAVGLLAVDEHPHAAREQSTISEMHQSFMASLPFITRVVVQTRYHRLSFPDQAEGNARRTVGR